MEIFLAKLFGLYFIIVGIIILIRRKSLMPAVKEFAANRALLLGFSVAEIVTGLAVVIAFPKVEFDLTGIISIIGYMMVVEGILYLGAPFKFIQRLVGSFNKSLWYLVGGILSVVLGIYLAQVGFGFF